MRPAMGCPLEGEVLALRLTSLRGVRSSNPYGEANAGPAVKK